MLKNYLTITLRSLRKHRGYTFLNLFGLAIGMACCVAIALYVRGELSYDQSYDGAENIYRVVLDFRMQELEMQTAYSARPLGPTLATDFPEVEHATRLWYDPSGQMTVRSGDQAFPEDRFFFADSTFFEVFGMPLLQGDPQTALRAPFTVVLTESTVRRYFGETNPIGQTLAVREPSDRDVFEYTVTGVMANLPTHTHLDFDLLASYTTQRQSRSESWLGFGVYTYVRVRPGTDPAALEAKLPVLFATYGGPQISESFGTTLEAFEEAGNGYRYFVQPITDIHLRSTLEDEPTPTGDVRVVYLFAAIAVLVLLLACVNFINLATARAARRAQEVGVRKTLGSRRSQLVAQFLTESMLMSLGALALAVGIVQIVGPLLSTATGAALRFAPGDITGYAPLLLGLGVLVGIGAGAYPAFYLSAFRPMAVLKSHRAKGRRSWLRDGLVVFQFGIAMALIVCTVVVYGQTQFMLEKQLGFEAEQVVVLEGAEVMGPQGEAFRTALRALPGVVSVTNAAQVPGRHVDGAVMRIAGAPDDTGLPIEYTYASFDFVETLGLEVVAGRSLSRSVPSDSLAVLLNEMAVQQFGLTDPIGAQIEWPGESVYTVVGVVRDFHVASLHREIGPMALLGPDPRNTNRPNLLAIARVDQADLPGTLAAVEATWSRFAPQHPFLYTFLDDTFAQLYEAERRTGRLITLFAGLAVLLACFGLFGLTAHMAAQRTKEIGVRKVLGATVSGIVLLLSRDFIKLVIVAIALAVPVSILVLRPWLDGFAYQIALGPTPFLLAGILLLVIALVTVSTQALRAATADPIKALHHE